MTLPNIDPIILVIICGLCGVGLIGVLVLQLLGGVFDIIGGVFGFVFDIIGGGPVAWCGCLVAVFGCAICGGFFLLLVNIFSTCGTPDAVNFCRLIGQ